MARKQIIQFTPLQREALAAATRRTTEKFRIVERANILLKYEQSPNKVQIVYAFTEKVFTFICGQATTLQRLARHTDINVTMRHYTHVPLATQSEAMEAVPEIISSESGMVESRKTGTDDTPEIMSPCVALKGGVSGHFGAPRGNKGRCSSGTDLASKSAGDTGFSSVSRALGEWHGKMNWVKKSGGSEVHAC